MEKIASFQVNHLTLVPGVYVSRRDKVGSETLTTFDLLMDSVHMVFPHPVTKRF